MGNSSSQAALAAVGAKGALNTAAQDLGLKESEADAQQKAKQKELESAANKKEQELRKQERANEYKLKTIEREGRKAKLTEKWKASHEGKRP